ncbi:MAG: hypothetical protein L3J66_05485 [Bacteroidales bacterium]|nr:hypothetical protein [Bacteroidales bacterium]
MKKLLSVLVFGVSLFNPAFSQSRSGEITLSIDTYREYEFQKDKPPDYSPFRYFTVSPLYKNTIWLGSSFLESELNLETGAFKNIKDILGFKINSSQVLSYKCTRQDPFDDDIFWIYLNGTGLIKYSRSLKTYNLFKENCSKSIAFTEEKVLLGGQNGLICSIDKSDESTIVFNTGLDEPVSSIIPDESGKYVLNHKYFYSPSENSTTFLSQSEIAKFKSNRFFKHWQRPSGFFNQVNQGKEIWFYKNRQLYVYDTVPDVLLKLDYGPPADILSLKADDTYLYLVCKTSNILMIKNDIRFVVVNKSFLRENAYIQNPGGSREERIFKLEENRFNKFWHASFDELITRLDDLNNKYSKSTSKYITDRLSGINTRLRSVAYKDDQRFSAENQIKTNTIKPYYLMPILYGLVSYYYKKADLEKVFYNDSILTSRFPDLEWQNETYVSSINLAKKVKIKLSNLDSLELATDVYLWKKAEICKELVSSDWNCGEMGCNPELYFQFYRELIERYPKSEYVDDVEFRILVYNQNMAQVCGELSSNLEFIEKYENFNKKYPDSKYKPNVLYRLAGLYSDALVSWEKLYEFNKIALEISYRVLSEYPDFEKNMYLPRFIEETKRNLPLLALNLSIESDKTVYNEGDPIYITFKLTNTFPDTNKIDIKGLDSIPIALIYVYDNYKRKFIFEKTKSYRDYWWKTLTLAPEETHTEKWDITKSALFGKNPYSFDKEYMLGNYTFPTGKYEITAYLYPYINERYMHSEPIQIEVR